MVSKNNPLRDSRHPEKYFPFVDFVRRPTSSDIRHPRTGAIYSTPYFWRVKNNTDGTAPDSGVEGELWYLVDITANVANWIIVGGATTQPIDSIDVDFNTAPGTDPVLPDIAGLASVRGNVVTNGTNANAPVATHSRAVNTFQIDIQLASAVSPTPGDPFDVGLASFNDAHFTVDANGFVSLAGGALAVDSLTGDDSTEVGPDGNGNINLTGEAVANATNVKPLYIDGDAGTNSQNFEIQVAAAINGAPGDKNDAGIASFNDEHFIVDTDGYVSLSGGGQAIDTVTGDDATPVSPDGNGNLNFTGEAVANATNAKPIYFDGDAGTNTQNAEIQVTTAVTGAPGDKLDAGIASFDDEAFLVNSDGYVELYGGPQQALYSNLGFDYTSGRFSIVGADGTALSATNPGYVRVQNGLDLGENLTVSLVKPYKFDDDSSAVTQDLAGWYTGMNSGDDWDEDRLFYVYVIAHDTPTSDPAIGISINPRMRVTFSTAFLNVPGTINSTDYQSVMLLPISDGMGGFTNPTPGDYDGNPCRMIGSFRMRTTDTANNDWTVQTFTANDGVGRFHEKTRFIMPSGVRGAASGKYFFNNAGTVPAFSINAVFYNINTSGLVTYWWSLTTATTAGVGAVILRLVAPYPVNNSNTGSGWLFDSSGSTTVPAIPWSNNSALSHVYSGNAEANNTFIELNDTLRGQISYFL